LSATSLDKAGVRARASGAAPGEVLIAAAAPDWGGTVTLTIPPGIGAAHVL
jgi:hypothetical protein